MTQFNGFDHVDVRVRSLRLCEPFYDRLLPALGLVHKRFAFVDRNGEWCDVPDGATPNVVEFHEDTNGHRGRFVGIIEDAMMRPTQTRLALRLSSHDELERWYARLPQIGARAVERSSDMTAYPAIFFEDPCGTRWELCAR
ncbi:MAG: VOC family protein [Candidatus Eremiobacteraeota bacterium]|nr:VOC family protein [Candidatus Eremiobacteraeota bacterium]MBV9646764.1 VOC family protein [Candidatus Eremiobacteraeota bacterium]